MLMVSFRPLSAARRHLWYSDEDRRDNGEAANQIQKH